MSSCQQSKRLAVAVFGGMLAIVAGGCAINQPGESTPMKVPANRTVPLALSGAQEVPPVTTEAAGTGAFEIPPDKSIAGEIATTGISATAAHIHEGTAGTNGPVIVPLTKTGDNTWSVAPSAKLTDAQYESYLAGKLYVNVHSAKYPGGEIRDQLKPR